MSVFKKYDIRGLLSDDFVIRLGNCFGTNFGSAVLLSDGKESSNHFLRLFANGVNQSGHDVINCGVGPTDMCSVAGKHFNLCSVMFTASHLAEGQDGIKFHFPSGLPFCTKELGLLRSLNQSFNESYSYREASFTETYFDYVINRFNEFFNDLSGLRVLIDLKNGCGLSHLLFERLGADVTVINSPGSNPSNSFNEAVSLASDFDLSIIHDFDADRVVVVDEGGIIHGSHIACLLTKLFNGLIVASIDSSQVLTDFTNIKYSCVGDPFIARSIISTKACLGVEPSGHYTDPEFVLTSSGSLFALLIGGLVKEHGLNELINDLPPINIETINLPVQDKHSFMNRIKSRVSNVISDIDGLKFLFKGAIALVRASGTEPVIRFNLENPQGVNVNELVSWLS